MDNSLPLIPWPQKLRETRGRFTLDQRTPISLPPGTDWLALATYLADRLEQRTGLHLSLASGPVDRPAISLVQLVPGATLGPEGYRLSIHSGGVQLAAPSAAGVFYAIQTLLQLIDSYPSGLPALEIEDHPRFAWRGMMLDVARHFFPVPVVKQLIDWLAAYKFNRLHLHLTDDQGWRLEIKSWPRLTEVGGSSSVDGDTPGFYTQAEYRQIVEYAASRYITVVPEIDLPGHTNAALASVPELNCNGQAPALYEGIEVGFSSLCIDKPITYQFVEDVLGEVAALTPGDYLHLGGDEAHSTEEAVYQRFVGQALALAAATGKTLVGWQEMAKAAVPAGTLLQFWDERLPFELPAGAQLIASPGAKAYMDMKYDADSPLGLSWAGTINAQQAYDWDPADLLPGLPEARIAGVEAPLWTETLRTQADLEYMLFPRLPGYGEIGWTAKERRQWAGYRPRLLQHAEAWKQAGLNIGPLP